MDYTKYTYKILCEDKRHYNFVRSYLNKKKDKYPKNGTKDTEYGKKLVDIVNNVKNTISYEFMPNSLYEMIKLLIKAENNC